LISAPGRFKADVYDIVSLDAAASKTRHPCRVFIDDGDFTSYLRTSCEVARIAAAAAAGEIAKMTV
jgi:hypothetical protein